MTVRSMVDEREAVVEFAAAVEASFLPRREKDELRREAEKGVTPELWRRLNDRLIDIIVEKQGTQKKYVQGLDAEIDRYTKAYEEEKSKLDRQLRARLKGLGEQHNEEREQLWSQYRERIARLQHRLLREVERTSSSVLHDVVLATVRADD